MRNVHRVRKNGQVFKYHRRTRASLPNDVPEDHPRFIAAWQREEAKDGSPKPRKAISGSIVAGCEEYLGSNSYRSLSESYRPVIRRHVEKIKEQAAAAPGVPMMRDLAPEDVQADLEPLTPAVASSRRKAWRKLAEFWKIKGHTRMNVSEGVSRKPMPKTDGHKEWSKEDLETFRSHWPIGSPQRTAAELLQWTGARCIDVVTIGPQMVLANGILAFRQRKTGVTAYVPWTAPAFGLEAQRADLLRSTDDAKALVFLLTIHGKPRSHKAFSQWFSKAARDAGLVGLTAHGLRKYRMNQLAEGGVSVLGMQSWVGHVTLQEVEEYTKRAQRQNVFFVNRPREFTISTTQAIDNKNT
jgi:integrase